MRDERDKLKSDGVVNASKVAVMSGVIDLDSNFISPDLAPSSLVKLVTQALLSQKTNRKSSCSIQS